MHPECGALWFMPEGFSIGSFGRDKSDLLNGEGPINSLFGRDHGRLFAMRLTRHECAPPTKADHFHICRPMPSTTASSIPRCSVILVELVAGGFRSRPQIWCIRTRRGEGRAGSSRRVFLMQLRRRVQLDPALKVAVRAQRWFPRKSIR
jgi:hypothetical protein